MSKEFKAFIEAEIDNAEDYLDSYIRGSIEDNLKYYNGELPAPATNGSSFVDDTVFTCSEHMLANVVETFSGKEIVDVTPEDPADVLAVGVANELINDTLDVVNNRDTVLTGWFKDALTTKNGILKVYKDIDKKLRTEQFTDVDVMLLPELLATYELEYDEVEQVITEEVKTKLEAIDPVTGLAIQMDSVTVSGYFEFTSNKEVVRIDNVPNENFIIDADAKRITDARCVGHKAAVTISDLVQLDFDQDVIDEVIQKTGDTSDVDDNRASVARRVNLVGPSASEDSTDPLMREVTLYELYVNSSIPEDSKTAKLYQVFYAEGVLLKYEEVNRAPYVDCIPFGSAHSFWGYSFTDKLKHIQRAKTGLVRAYMENVAKANRPRYFYTEGKVDMRSMLSTATGAHVGMKEGGSIGLMQTLPLPNGTDNLINRLSQSAQDITGVSFQGQGLLADVVKSGGSTATASMALSQMQLYEKSIIKGFTTRGVEPLIRLVYDIIREEFSQYTITINNQALTINPSTDLPATNMVRVRAELGSNIKFEKAMTLTGFRDSLLAQATASPEVAKLVKAENIYNMNKQILDYQGVKTADMFMQVPAAVNQADELAQQMQALSGQMQALTQQVQSITAERDQLLMLNNERIKTELQLKKEKQDTDAMVQADKMNLEERKFKHVQEVDADKQALSEVKVQAEINNPKVSL